MNVLVDTSVWVAHFKQANEHLIDLLNAGWVVCHPYVVVEIACGTPPARQSLVDMLTQLESVPVATPDELLQLIERRGLQGRGCGFVDVSLLASALFTEQTRLWTLDKRLEAVAADLGRSYRQALQS
ncbi:MAG: PIN domain-containing protein [Pseudomonadota bacterium]|nr:PIN domain-containing protein [Pseudomonadota bacterium]